MCRNASYFGFDYHLKYRHLPLSQKRKLCNVQDNGSPHTEPSTKEHWGPVHYGKKNEALTHSTVLSPPLPLTNLKTGAKTQKSFFYTNKITEKRAHTIKRLATSVVVPSLLQLSLALSLQSTAFSAVVQPASPIRIQPLDLTGHKQGLINLITFPNIFSECTRDHSISTTLSILMSALRACSLPHLRPAPRYTPSLSSASQQQQQLVVARAQARLLSCPTTQYGSIHSRWLHLVCDFPSLG